VRADFLLSNASEVLTCAGPAPRCGSAQREAGSLSRGIVAAANGTIVYVGPEDGWRRELSDDAVRVDARGGTVVPGLVDAHTHLVFGGDRQGELRRRLAGASYADIAADGGGIIRTVELTRAAAEADLASGARLRLSDMLRSGTTTAEAKSGYGLTLESELKMLRVARSLGRTQPIDIVSTFLGAHEIPPEYRDRRRAYIDLVVEQMIPAVAESRLADWGDVFCEAGVFTVPESREILSAARQAGLGLRVHADEFGRSGGSRLAAELRVRSADHLVWANEEDARMLAEAGVVATLMPAASLYLKLGRFAPARTLIEAGVPVALGSDVNPGAGLSPSMPFAMTLACFAMQMTFEEALVAATINAAYSLDRHELVGSLEVGKQMDAVVIDGSAVGLLRVGADSIAAVIKRGQVVYAAREQPRFW
jgi:imidazolonepropionase